MKKRLLALSMIAAMTAAMLAGCGTAGDSNNGGTADTKSASAEANTSKDDSGEYPEYKFGTNIWGSGSYVLESNAKTANVNYSGLGITVDGISNEFTADKITTDVQTQISDGCQAILEMCVTPPSFMSVSQICEENGIPFVLYDKTPGDEATKAAVESKSTYAGTIVCSDYQFGYEIGQKCIEDGCKKVILVRSSIGDASHDEREKGFTAAFVDEGKGEILGSAVCANPGEAVDKSNDAITAYGQSADCIYALGSDFATGTINAIAARSDSYSKELKIYTTDFTPDTVFWFFMVNIHWHFLHFLSTVKYFSISMYEYQYSASKIYKLFIISSLLYFYNVLLYQLFNRRHVGMADEADSKSVVGNYVWVQVPLPALFNIS